MNNLEIINERAAKSKPKPTTYNIWENSPFEEPIRGRTSDDRGYFGEGLVNDYVSKLTNFECKWLRDSNTSQGDVIYDIWINGYRTEVKTASASLDRKTGKISYKFQHENIYKEKVWDKLVLVDIEPNGVYWTILNHSEMNFEGKHPILKTSATKHLSAYKFDTAFSTKSKNGCNLNRGINAGITIYIPNDSNTSKLSAFLTKHLS